MNNISNNKFFQQNIIKNGYFLHICTLQTHPEIKTGFPCVHISTLFLLQGILLSMQGNGSVFITGIFEQIQSFQFIL